MIVINSVIIICGVLGFWGFGVLGISTFLGLKSVLAAIYGVMGMSLVMSTSIIVVLIGLSVFVVIGVGWKVFNHTKVVE